MLHELPAVTEPTSFKTGRRAALADTFTIREPPIIRSDRSHRLNREAYSVMFLVGVSNVALFCEVPSSYSLRSPVP
jgi:hypothetical protein